MFGAPKEVSGMNAQGSINVFNSLTNMHTFTDPSKFMFKGDS